MGRNAWAPNTGDLLACSLCVAEAYKLHWVRPQLGARGPVGRGVDLAWGF